MLVFLTKSFGFKLWKCKDIHKEHIIHYSVLQQPLQIFPTFYKKNFLANLPTFYIKYIKMAS